jgi:hypothetical protein
MRTEYNWGLRLSPKQYHLRLIDVIAWLKRQDELAIFLSKIKVLDMVSRNEIGVIVNYSQLERMDKSANKKKVKKIGRNK